MITSFLKLAISCNSVADLLLFTLLCIDIGTVCIAICKVLEKSVTFICEYIMKRLDNKVK